MTKVDNIDIPRSVSFNKMNPDANITNWNKNNNNNLANWIKTGLMIKIEDWLFVNKDVLNEQKEDLEKWYELLELKTIKLNNLQDEIKHYCRIKANEISKIAHDTISTKEPHHYAWLFLYSCREIIKQPQYLIEADEKHSANLTDHQKTYYQHKHLADNFNFGRDKSFLLRKSIEDSILLKLINKKGGNTINEVFLFMQLFINKLKINNISEYKYFESPLFRLLFDDIIKYKNYEAGQFPDIDIIEDNMPPTTSNTWKNHLEHLKGYNLSKEKIMPDNEYIRLINLVSQLIETKKVPKNNKPFNLMGISGNSIRYSFYKIQKSIFTDNKTKEYFIHFLNTNFNNLRNQSFDTIKTKFSTKPDKYPF